MATRVEDRARCALYIPDLTLRRRSLDGSLQAPGCHDKAAAFLPFRLPGHSFPPCWITYRDQAYGAVHACRPSTRQSLEEPLPFVFLAQGTNERASEREACKDGWVDKRRSVLGLGLVCFFFFSLSICLPIAACRCCCCSPSSTILCSKARDSVRPPYPLSMSAVSSCQHT